MIYYLICSKVNPGSSFGYISDLLQDLWTDRKTAERAFHDLVLTGECFCKELWVKEPSGRRYMLMEERYAD